MMDGVRSPLGINQIKMRDYLVEKLWRGNDPFDGFPNKFYATDTQGWNSQHGYLADAINQYKPKLTVEVGVWKGASIISMAKRLREDNVEGVILAVDTWLGSWDHWLSEQWHPDLFFEYGYPQLQRVFMSNIVAEGLQEYVLPLPLDSANAAELLRRYRIVVDLVHLDGAHDYGSVRRDMEAWWSLLRPGGLFIGDDYFAENMWPEVKQATDEFLATAPHTNFEHHNGKFRVVKP
jgi:predicted O-methyltransferase YrrM